jgi:hypothetical protein
MIGSQQALQVVYDYIRTNGALLSAQSPMCSSPYHVKSTAQAKTTTSTGRLFPIAPNLRVEGNVERMRRMTHGA